MISILFGTGGAEDDLSMREMLSMMSCGAGRECSRHNEWRGMPSDVFSNCCLFLDAHLHMFVHCLQVVLRLHKKGMVVSHACIHPEHRPTHFLQV